MTAQPEVRFRVFNLGARICYAIAKTEIMIVLRRFSPHIAQSVPASLEEFDLHIVSPNIPTASLAAEARARFSINFGDTFCYALAKFRNEPILTLDADFAQTDAELVPL